MISYSFLSVSGLSKWDTVNIGLSSKRRQKADNRALASPYLLELGLSKSLMSLVFVAGPLSGLIMQPLIGEGMIPSCADTDNCRLIVLERATGIFADRSQSRFGRRRPFMIIGCVVSMFAMMLLGWAREISAFFGGVRPGGQLAC